MQSLIMIILYKGIYNFMQKPICMSFIYIISQCISIRRTITGNVFIFIYCIR